MKDKKKALSIAVATALVIANPLSMTGCTTSPYANEEDKENQYIPGNGGSNYSNHSLIRSGSSKSGNSNSTWSSPAKGSTSGYSGSHGGGTSG